MAQASKVGKKTNKKTQSGRDVYETPEGEMVSEKSTTFKYKGKWINVPTIHKGKQYDDSTLKLMLDAEIIEPTSIHNSLESAKKAAQERTDSLEFNEGGAVTDMDEDLQKEEIIKKYNLDDAKSNWKVSPSKFTTLISNLPTNFKLLTEFMLGKDKPININDFTKDELVSIITLAEKQEENKLNIKNRKLKGQPENITTVSGYDLEGRTKTFPDWVENNPYFTAIANSLSSPDYQVRTSLGKYDVEETPSSLIIKDAYDMNIKQRDLPKIGDRKNLSKILDYIRVDPEMAGEFISNIIRPNPKDSRKFDLVIPKRKPDQPSPRDTAYQAPMQLKEKPKDNPRIKEEVPEGFDLLKFNEGGDVSAQTNNLFGYTNEAVTDMEEEMNDMLLDEQVDPVSGNTAPVGALPSEVRDDIDIRVSENEYVIPAYAVRYFGEDFFDELLGSAKEGWERIKEGDELPFRDDELEVADDKEELKEGYAEGGNIPGTEVPKPVGGGYGRYGGTGAVYTGFESRTFVNPETGREIVIFFFNGRPISRVPEGFRPKGETVVEEQQQVQRERDDDDDKVVSEAEKSWRNTPVSDWTNTDYKDYNEDLASKIRKGEDPLGLNIIEKGILSSLGAVIGGPIGSIGLPILAKKMKQQQAEAAHTQAINLMQSSSDKDIISAADATRYITGSALQKEGYAVSVADPFSGDYKSDDDRNIFDRLFGRQGDLDPVTGMPTAEAVRQRNLAQYGSETSNYMEDPFAPPSRAVGETVAGTSNIKPNDSGGAESASEAMERIQKENKKEVEKAQERIDKKEEKSVTIGGSRFG